ncbi:TPA: hypothetical protein DEA21_01820 [Candidatus Uhrbacteria bacterium]|nr:hypothetical protein [Candidatus Uhrbacteria bacterium]HCU32121.1 hypothetical protein [Candidatus Uhrbacteria bacterium]
MATSLIIGLGSPVLVLAAHFIGDFAWQTTWMGLEKGKDWNAMLAHCATYTAAFVLFSCLPVNFFLSSAAVVVIFLTHVAIDTLKARFGLITSIWLDQLCHFAVLASLFSFGMIR